MGSFALTSNDMGDGGPVPPTALRRGLSGGSEGDGPGYIALVVAVVVAVVLSVIITETLAGYRRSRSGAVTAGPVTATTPTVTTPATSTPPGTPATAEPGRTGSQVARPVGDASLVAVTATRIEKVASEVLSWFVVDLELEAKELDEPVKGLKGVLQFVDPFGDVRVAADLTILMSLEVGGTAKAVGYRLVYDEFDGGHAWLAGAAPGDVRPQFLVEELLRPDGSVRRCGVK